MIKSTHMSKKCILFFLILLSLKLSSQSVGIGEDVFIPHSSSILEIRSQERGILIPRMTTSERDAISNPAEGLLIYNTTSNRLNYWNGSAWVEVLGLQLSAAQNNTSGVSSGVFIGATISSPHPSAILEIYGTHGGLLLPGMTTAQRDAIMAPANGLLIYNLDTKRLNYYDMVEGWKEVCGFISGNTTGANNPGYGVLISEIPGMPHPSAVVEVRSTNKGMLIPRMTTIERNNIPSPATGLWLYNTDTKTFQVYQGNNIWIDIGPNSIMAPVALPASGAGASNFVANWNSVQGATGYRLDVSTNSSFSSFVSGYNNLDVGNVTSRNVTGLSCGTYYYRVRAYNECGVSVNSNVETGTTNPSTSPSAPIANTATSVGASSFTANWNPSAGATGYYLDVATNSSFTNFVPGYNNLNVGNFISYNVNLPSCGTYYYRVRAYNSCGISSNSNTITVTTVPASVPAAPVATAATGVSTTGFTANWNSASGAAGYRLDVSTSSTFTTFVSGYNNLDVGNVTSFNVTGIACGTTYYYRVRAYNACGVSTNSNTINVTTSACATIVCQTQQWMTTNMNVGIMINLPSQQPNDAQVDKYCYNNIAANCATYGGLYPWTEGIQIPYSFTNNTYGTQPWMTCDPCGSGGRQGICPSGFHVPTDLEFSRYEWCVEQNFAPAGTTPLSTFQNINWWRGSNSTAGPGYKMKTTSPTWNGSNASGFTALPGGFGHGAFGFDRIGNEALFWTATEAPGSDASNYAWYRALATSNYESARNITTKYSAFSIRCIKD